MFVVREFGAGSEGARHGIANPGLELRQLLQRDVIVQAKRLALIGERLLLAAAPRTSIALKAAPHSKVEHARLPHACQ